ncbi:MAG: mannose-1-phosphate guanylyltransferase [Gemmatimonadetes bacterium]|nr:mannose-1-phosphate guanylyltransferase [Gemmatimonadota bacterium]
MTRWAAVLAGGSGTRFWPLSTPEIPKQMLALAGDLSLLEQAVRRLEGLIAPTRIIVVTAERLRSETAKLLAHIPNENILGEPQPASTGPALTWATVYAAQRDPDASILSLHADWFVGDDQAFRETASRALDVAEGHDVLVTVGIVPDRPEVGYGYIEPGDPLGREGEGEGEGDARSVVRFTEKPSREEAVRLVASGALWNSGLFAWTSARFLAETRAVATEISGVLAQLEAGDVQDFFANVTAIAVDYSHFERSDRVAVVPGNFPWDDVGTWGALSRVRSQDNSGNVLVGDTVQRDASNCVVWAEDGAVVIDGVQGLVVVQANGVTLVTTTERAAHLKQLLASLPPRFRPSGGL